MNAYQSPVGSIRVYDSSEDAHMAISHHNGFGVYALPDGRFAACPTVHAYMACPDYIWLICEQQSTSALFDLMVGKS